MKAKVLVVDDEEAIRLLVRITLEEDGHEVIEAVDAATLRQAFKETAPDLVILDLKLPDGDGLDLLPEMKKNWPRSKTIILTGYGSVEAAEKAYLVDEVYIQCKPFDAGILRALVNVALYSRKRPPTERVAHTPPDSKG
jgi:DNA-binding NtrC family response regulator